jgi:hypothetical protein
MSRARVSSPHGNNRTDKAEARERRRGMSEKTSEKRK